MEVTIKFIVHFVEVLVEYITDSKNFNQEVKDQVFDFKSPLVFYYKNLYFRISFRIIKNNLYFFLNIHNIGEKMLLLDLNDKLDFKNRLIRSLSHELMTPLHQIINKSQRLIDYMADDEEIVDCRGMIVEDATMIMNLTQKLSILVKNIFDYSLMLSKSFALIPGRVNIRQLMEELLDIYRKKISLKRLKLTLDVEDYTWITDINRLKGALSILIENSIKYTVEGQIKIVVKKCPTKEKLEFKITDTGEGMSEADLLIINEMIKNPLSSLKTNKSTGLGLGLRMAYAMIKLLSYKNSQMRIESFSGRGTKVSFSIRRLKRINVLKKKKDGAKKVINQVKSFLNDQKLSEKSDDELEVEKLIEINSVMMSSRGNDEDLIQPQKKRKKSLLPKSTYSKEALKRKRTSQSVHPKFVEKHNEIPDNESERMIVAENIARSNISVFGPDNHLKTISYARQVSDIKAAQQAYKRINFNGPNRQTLQAAIPDPKSSPHEPPDSPSDVKDKDKDKDQHSTDHNSPSESFDIMVVDDDVTNIQIMAHLLKRVGKIQVHEAFDGIQCLDKIKEMHKENQHRKKSPLIDLILLDYSMPRMNGDECARQLRAAEFAGMLGEVPIIGISANDDKKTINLCMEAGMNDFYTKPIGLPLIKEILKKYSIIK